MTWSGPCDRCGGEADIWTVSMFNTDRICMPCEGVERAHPAYAAARAAEERAVRAGDFNFPGIGLPTSGWPPEEGAGGA